MTQIKTDGATSAFSRRTTLGALVAGVFALIAGSNLFAAPPASSIDIIPTITGISVQNGQLVATGTATATVRGRTTTVPFTAPVNLSLAPDQNGAGVCRVLNLELAPISLNLLGLVVETSSICLDITAQQGGGLLGDLLCAVGNLLNGGLTLNQILAGQGVGTLPGLTTAQIDTLLGGLTGLLNGLLGNLLDAIVAAITQGVGATCDILHLELGPLDLNLLGLRVVLDDCEGGPVVVDLTGQRGRGNLLGNLLCGLLASGQGGGLGAALGDILDAILNRLNP